MSGRCVQHDAYSYAAYMLPSIERQPDGCWHRPNSTRGVRQSTVKLKDGSRMRYYVIMYIALVAPVPPGMELDHRCNNPACVNPYHLLPTTRKENAGRYNREKTVCRNGHEMNEANTRVDRKSGARFCRPCNTAYARERRRLKK